MARQFPYVRSEDGSGYECQACGNPLPDGVQVFPHYTGSGTVTGVEARNLDGQVVHKCGTGLGHGEGQV